MQVAGPSIRPAVQEALHWNVLLPPTPLCYGQWRWGKVLRPGEEGFHWSLLRVQGRGRGWAQGFHDRSLVKWQSQDQSCRNWAASGPNERKFPLDIFLKTISVLR